MRYIYLFALLLLLAVPAAMPAHAADVVVGTGSAASCTETAFDQALATVTSGSTISFNCGGPATITFTSQKVLDAQGKSYIIDGGGNITLDGAGATRLFRVQNGRNQSLTLRGITLANGRAAGYPDSGDDSSQGGAILFGYGNDTLRIENSRFYNNVAVTNGGQWDGGGAIHIRIAHLVIEDSVFEGNSAPNGGAMNILITTGSVTNTVFRNNSATTTIGGGGGAIYIDNGMLTFDRVLVENNTSTKFGAGYFNCGGSKNIGHETILNSTFRNNTITGDGTGAGVYNCDDGISISGTTINNNTGPTHAGGFWHHSNSNPASTATVTNSTITGNTAVSGNGAGVVSNGPAPMTITHSVIAYNATGVQGSAIRTGEGTVTLVNTIIAHNTSAHEWVNTQCHGTMIDGGGNIQFPSVEENGRDARCSPSFTTADPLLVALADNGGLTQTHALPSGSPAVNAAAGCPVLTDQRGVVRPQGGACDSGPFELESQSAGSPANLNVTLGSGAPLLPTFTWTHQADENATSVPAAWYQVYLLAGGVSTEMWFEASEVCSGMNCSATRDDANLFGGTNIPLPFGLLNGEHLWWVLGWSQSGGQWRSQVSNGAAFRVDRPAPSQIQRGSLTGTTANSGFIWTADPNASWYRIYAAGDNGTVFDQWVEGAEVCNGTSCTYPFSYHLTNGNYQWWMNAWGPGGEGAWDLTPATFSLDLAAPDVVTVTGDLQWESSNNASWYHIYITNGAGYTYDQWQQALNVCSGSTCTLPLELNPGSYTWYIQAWGPGGMGGWTDANTFSR